MLQKSVILSSFTHPTLLLLLPPLFRWYRRCYLNRVQIRTSPSSDLANTILDKAINTLEPWEKPIVHSDRGGHYRWDGWISRMESSGLTRSMSKKGCSPDNSACEGFFGRIKNEVFYGRDWKGWVLDDLMYFIDRYLNWFRNERIKIRLNNKSPKEYRTELGLAL